MAITPQAIKDQEFQSKFRGYDTVEVKAYLELVAEEFFELLEKLRQQEQELVDLVQAKELGEEIKKRLEDDVEASQRTVEELRKDLADRDEKIAEIQKDQEEMQTALDDFEQERTEFEEEVSAAEGRVSEIDEKLQESKSVCEGLRNKVKMLEEQNHELMTAEVDFKQTIGVAQRFVDDLTTRTQAEADALKAESEAKASEMLHAARVQIENLRLEAYASLSRLPEEIERMSKQRAQVRDDLRSILTKHLEEIDSYSDVEVEIKHYDYDELFPRDENLVDDEDATDDELDNISMDLILDDSPAAEEK